MEYLTEKKTPRAADPRQQSPGANPMPSKVGRQREEKSFVKNIPKHNLLQKMRRNSQFVRAFNNPIALIATGQCSVLRDKHINLFVCKFRQRALMTRFFLCQLRWRHLVRHAKQNPTQSGHCIAIPHRGTNARFHAATLGTFSLPLDKTCAWYWRFVGNTPEVNHPLTVGCATPNAAAIACCVGQSLRRSFGFIAPIIGTPIFLVNRYSDVFFRTIRAGGKDAHNEDAWNTD